MNKTKKDWLDQIKEENNNNDENILIYILESFSDIVIQYINSPDSVACKSLVERALKCNKYFLKYLKGNKK